MLVRHRYKHMLHKHRIIVIIIIIVDFPSIVYWINCELFPISITKACKVKNSNRLTI